MNSTLYTPQNRLRMLRPFARYPILIRMLAALGIAFLGVGQYKLQSLRHIRQAGVETRGTLLSVAGQAGKKTDVTYGFEVGNMRYIYKAVVGAGESGTLKDGDPITVWYLAEDPTRNVTSITWPTEAYMFTLSGGIVIGFAVLIFWEIRKEKRKGVTL